MPRNAPADELELSMLSAAEREAMEDDEDEPQATGATDDEDDDDDARDDQKAAPADAPDSEDDEPAGAADSEDDADDEEEIPAPAATDPPAAPQDEARHAESHDDRFRPVYQADPVEDYESKLAELDKTKAEAFAKFADGDMEPAEYAKIEAKYLADRDALRSAQERAVLSEEMRAQAAQQEWSWEVKRFFRETVKGEGIDYAKDDKLYGALDRWCKMLATDPANGDKSGEWFLGEAHKMVKLQFNLAKSEPAAAEAPPKKAPPKREPDLRNLPPNLGKAPAAKQAEEMDDGEFAHLDRLSGMDLERAISKLSPEAQERYLAA